MKNNSELWTFAPKVTSSLFNKTFLPEMCDIYLSEDEAETGTIQERKTDSLTWTRSAGNHPVDPAFRGGDYINVAPADAGFASDAASLRNEPPWLPLPRTFQQPLASSPRTKGFDISRGCSAPSESQRALSSHSTRSAHGLFPHVSSDKARDHSEHSQELPQPGDLSPTPIHPFLDEIPLPDDGPPEDLPVAATLVQSLDLFQRSSRKRSAEFPYEGGDFKDSDDEELDNSEGDQKQRFRAYQEDQWSERFRELTEYKQQHGHTMVPHNFKGNLPLARWVKRQRNQYKQLKEEGTSSTMTEERIRALEGIGFVWDCQRIAWDEKLIELREYRDVHRDCNVPTNYPENPKLAMWVKCQRRQYKLFLAGQQSSMTVERINQLEDLGFSWGLRSYKKMKRS